MCCKSYKILNSIYEIHDIPLTNIRCEKCGIWRECEKLVYYKHCDKNKPKYGWMVMCDECVKTLIDLLERDKNEHLD